MIADTPIQACNIDAALFNASVGEMDIFNLEDTLPANLITRNSNKERQDEDATITTTASSAAISELSSDEEDGANTKLIQPLLKNSSICKQIQTNAKHKKSRVSFSNLPKKLSKQTSFRVEQSSSLAPKKRRSSSSNHHHRRRSSSRHSNESRGKKKRSSRRRSSDPDATMRSHANKKSTRKVSFASSGRCKLVPKLATPEAVATCWHTSQDYTQMSKNRQLEAQKLVELQQQQDAANDSSKSKLPLSSFFESDSFTIRGLEGCTIDGRIRRNKSKQDSILAVKFEQYRQLQCNADLDDIIAATLTEEGRHTKSHRRRSSSKIVWDAEAISRAYESKQHNAANNARMMAQWDKEQAQAVYRCGSSRSVTGKVNTCEKKRAKQSQQDNLVSLFRNNLVVQPSKARQGFTSKKITKDTLSLIGSADEILSRTTSRCYNKTSVLATTRI